MHVILEAWVSLLMEWCVVLKLETSIVTVIETQPMDALSQVEADRASDSCIPHTVTEVQLDLPCSFPSIPHSQLVERSYFIPCGFKQSLTQNCK